MKNYLIIQFYLLFNVLVKLNAALPFGGIFPLLTTGWYYKPGPVESIVLGLIVVKVLAIRLGATLSGVPYHLNDIFDNQKLFSWTQNRGRRNVYFENNNGKLIPLSSAEIQVVERILLALKRIDSHDCFIRYICQVKQNSMTGQSTTAVDDTWLYIFRLRPTNNSLMSFHRPMKNETSIWDIYEDALSPTVRNCSEKYSNCPLPMTDMGLETILSGIF